ncbi:Hsp20/alpha crystallin family protein [Candidatus Micrarchaeota archaeon]|nr:Hsp20/alpha crystallin family protein [Candidatus Micrarchaeota archaeon]
MMPKKRRGFFFSDDFEEEFERLREEMERMMGDAFKITGETEKSMENKPFVYGFSMRIGPDGKPVVQEFGNIKPKLKGAEDEIEPLIDVIEEKEIVTIIAEVPGINKEEISLKATEETLSIRVDNAGRKYNKIVKLPVKVKPETAKANYKNGVLEVKLEKIEKKSDSEHKIKVE